MADLRIADQRSLKAWLRGQSHEVAILIAVRVALRVLPLFAHAAPGRADGKAARQFEDWTGALFRAAALARVAAAYPTRANELRASASASASAAFAASAANAASASAAAAAAAAADAAAAVSAADASASAAGAAFAADAAARAASFAASAAAAIWDSIMADATRAQAIGMSALADAPLWPDRMPGWASEAWASLRSALPEGDDWNVWSDWYEQRRRGASRGEAYEIVFATAPPKVWDKGAAAANAWIREHLSKPPLPAPLDNLPSAFTYGWNASGRIALVAGPQNTPFFPFPTSEADHRALLEAVHEFTERLNADLRARKFDNVRGDYLDALERYVGDLPTAPGVGNFVLADMEALDLRTLFEAEADILPSPFATRLRTLLQFHIALRANYPEMERVYAAVGKGRLQTPLPMDAVAAATKVVADNTPRFFEPEVIDGLDAVERAPPIVELTPEDRRDHAAAVLPPPDPLGALGLEKSLSFIIASAFNSLTNVVVGVGAVGSVIRGWEEVARLLRVAVGPIIEWLRTFLGL